MDRVKKAWRVSGPVVEYHACGPVSSKVPEVADLIFVVVTVLAFVVLTVVVRGGQRL
jgi:hypothetical protein